MNLLLVVDGERGALARILLTAERRGFRPVQMTATEIGGGFLVHLAVESTREIGMLRRMLARLQDVRRVTLAEDLGAEEVSRP